MSDTARFGVSLSRQLLDEFDELIEEKNYSNRSEAIRDLIREELIHSEWEAGEEKCVGTISLVYHHHTRQLMTKLTEIQHDYTDEIIANTHIHLDKENCLEVIAVVGPANTLKEISDRLQSTRGVIHAKLSMTTTGEKLE